VEGVETEVAVIGAGLAGLSAARALEASGIAVEVIEARDRVGGRTVAQPIGGGKVVELGGQWVGPGQKRILALISELGLETFPTFGDGLKLTEHRGRVRSYRGTIPKGNPLALAEVAIALRKLDRLASEVDPDCPWEIELARLDRITFDTWMRRNVRTSSGRDLMRLAIEAVWAAEPDVYLEKVWADDEWSRGCYGGYFPPGAWTSHGSALREPVGPIYWAGAETASHWAGYMEGAIQSGRRPAHEVESQRRGSG
jgi:monoamine oxidase